MTPDYQADGVTLYRGDCRDVMPMLPGESFDLVFTDPPYPEIDRPYGRLTEAEWFELMRAVVPEVRRVLKPQGSAVFVLQPNSERVGRMRTWLWEFLAWVGKEWGVVQDAWWWNYSAMPQRCSTHHGLMRPSLKACVWCGPPDCYRDQDAALWDESAIAAARRRAVRAGGVKATAHDSPGGHHVERLTVYDAAEQRGGVTPFNVFPAPNDMSGRKTGHGASTPLALCDWWSKYLVPPGGAVFDPFAGSGTTGVVTLRQGKTFVGIEKETAYVGMARKRLTEVHGPLFAPREEPA